MERTPEPELMEGEAQAAAYAGADFSQPNQLFVDTFRQRFPGHQPRTILDLGCGPADIPCRLARLFAGATIDCVDGSTAMLAHARQRIEAASLDKRIRLIHATLPATSLGQGCYDAVVSNSLLHHLADPMVLWESVARYTKKNGAVLVMDLKRPESREKAEELVELYAREEPEVLKKDFFCSLLAAYRPEEVEEQLARAGLGRLTVGTISDRHLMVAGVMP